MTPSVALVATNSTGDTRDLLVARLRALVDAGWDARLHCKGDHFTRVRAFADRGLGPRIEVVSGRRRELPPVAALRDPVAFGRYLRSEGAAAPFGARQLATRPDLVHYHSGSAASRGIRLKRLHGCRVVVSFRADGRDISVPGRMLLWEHADLLLFPSPSVLERAVAAGCPRDRADVLEAPLLMAEPGAGRSQRATGPLRILSVGALTWEHGFEHSVHAMRLLLERGVDFEYRIVGDGDHLTAVSFARHQLGLDDRVHLIEPDGAQLLERELRAADVVVDPAVADTISPVPLLTAQALGVPFVATERRGLAREAGIPVPRRNPGAIAEGLATLARDPGLRTRMGEAGRARAPALPTLTDHVARLERLYRRALA